MAILAEIIRVCESNSKQVTRRGLLAAVIVATSILPLNAFDNKDSVKDDVILCPILDWGFFRGRVTPERMDFLSKRMEIKDQTAEDSFFSRPPEQIFRKVRRIEGVGIVPVDMLRTPSSGELRPLIQRGDRKDVIALLNYFSGTAFEGVADPSSQIFRTAQNHIIKSYAAAIVKGELQTSRFVVDRSRISNLRAKVVENYVRAIEKARNEVRNTGDVERLMDWYDDILRKIKGQAARGLKIRPEIPKKVLKAFAKREKRIMGEIDEAGGFEQLSLPAQRRVARRSFDLSIAKIKRARALGAKSPLTSSAIQRTIGGKVTSGPPRMRVHPVYGDFSVGWEWWRSWRFTLDLDVDWEKRRDNRDRIRRKIRTGIVERLRFGGDEERANIIFKLAAGGDTPYREGNEQELRSALVKFAREADGRQGMMVAALLAMTANGRAEAAAAIAGESGSVLRQLYANIARLRAAVRSKSAKEWRDMVNDVIQRLRGLSAEGRLSDNIVAYCLFRLCAESLAAEIGKVDLLKDRLRRGRKVCLHGFASLKGRENTIKSISQWLRDDVKKSEIRQAVREVSDIPAAQYGLKRDSAGDGLCCGKATGAE